MSTFSDSYVLNVLLTQRPNGQGETARRSCWLRRSLFDRYWHELHYMRGPGPKCQEKQACGVRRKLGSRETNHLGLLAGDDLPATTW
jgi:hypothetical protein